MSHSILVTEELRTMQSPQVQHPPRGGTLRQLLVEKISGGRLALPVLPGSSAQVLAMCQDPMCDVGQLSETIRNDPSLTGHVLRVANSAAYAPREPIVDLRTAISRIGLAAFGGIVVGMSVREKMFRMRGFEPRLRALWRHSATTGVWAMEIARLRTDPVEGAFLAGLLHDMGKAVVLQALGDLSRTRVEKLDHDVCEELMEEFHAEVGADLLRNWAFPEGLVEAVRHHHHAETSGGDHGDLASTIALADLFAHWSLEVGPDGRGSAIVAPLGAGARFADAGLDPAHVPALLARAERVIEMAGSF